MGVGARQKSAEITLICYFLISIIFWLAVFCITPYHKAFTLTKTQAERIQTIDNTKVFNYKEYFRFDQEYLEKIEKIQPYIEVGILIYGFLGVLIIVSLESKLRNKYYFASIVILYVGVYVIAALYYKYFYNPFIPTSGSFDGFLLIKIAPYYIVCYALLRKLFMFIMEEEPRIVGKWELFSDPINWLFTFFVTIASVILVVINPWF